MRTPIAMLCIIVSMPFSAASAKAQGGPCGSCLTLTPVVELKSSAGPIVPSAVQSVLRTRDGRWLVSHRFVGPAQFAEYDKSGRLLGIRGKAGQGPGEYYDPPQLFPGPKNTIWAIDRTRVVRLDQDLRHVETGNLEGPVGVVTAFVLGNGTVLIDSRLRDAEGYLFTVALLDTAGNVIRKLARQPADRYKHTVIAPAATDGFWAIQSNQLVLRRYSIAGDVERTYHLIIDGFQPWEDTTEREGTEVPPRPRHHAIVDTGNEQIIVLTRVADKDWKPTVSTGVIRPSQIDYNRQFDTLVTLLDLRSGRTIASTRFPEGLMAVNGARNLFFTPKLDEFGDVITRVLELRVRRP